MSCNTSGDCAGGCDSCTDCDCEPISLSALFARLNSMRLSAEELKEGEQKLLREVNRLYGKGPYRWQGEEVTIVERAGKMSLRTKTKIAQEV